MYNASAEVQKKVNLDVGIATHIHSAQMSSGDLPAAAVPTR
jgi:hypothetical protein